MNANTSAVLTITVQSGWRSRSPPCTISHTGPASGHAGRTGDDGAAPNGTVSSLPASGSTSTLPRRSAAGAGSGLSTYASRMRACTASAPGVSRSAAGSRPQGRVASESMIL